MKAKVVIEQGRTKVVLTADNDFEKDVIEQVKDFNYRYNIETTVQTDYAYHNHSNHRIELDIIRKAEK